MRPLRILSAVAVVGVAAGSLAAAPSFAGTPTTVFHRTATYPVYLNVPAGVPASSATVAEISAVTDDGETLVYTDALGKRIGFLDISNPAAPAGLGTIDLAVAGHADDQPTSVAVVGDYVLVVVDTSGGDFAHPSGRVDVVRMSDRTTVRSIAVAGQPDSITVSDDTAYAAIAIENQRDEEFTPAGGDEGDLPQAPGGFVQVLGLTGAPADWTSTAVPFTEGDGSALPSFSAAGLDTPADPEPEYVAINSANKLAVTLQENNGVVIVDLASKTIEKVFSAGSVAVSGIDVTKDATFNPTGSIPATPREPDSIQWIGEDYLATANEGDWKGGTRGWTVFDAGTGTPVWDAGNRFEKLTTSLGLFTNDRAAKKGPEPEGLAVAEFDGTTYAFVGSERSNFVAVYDMTDPTDPDYVQALASTNGPEGILPIPGRDLLAVSSETDDASKNVRASVALFELGAGPAEFPSIQSKLTWGSSQPIGWSALGALTADPLKDDILYSASDAAVKPARIYTVDVSGAPALITRVTEVTDGSGVTQNLDIEGLFARPDGGFWAASEGATGAANTVYRLSAAGVIQEAVTLPTTVTDHIGKWGLEGVTATKNDGTEFVWVALQRPQFADVAAATGELDGAGITRIGRYNTVTHEWHWFGYQLESTAVAGDWMGLSEITAIDGDTLAVIERDKLNGPRAAIKRIYTVDIPASDPASFTVLPKKLAVDVLPALTATNGWTQEKLEGFTVAGNGDAYAVTDNDALIDSTGETAFLKLGSAAAIFGPTPPTSAPTPTATTPAPTPTVTVTASPAPIPVVGSHGSTVRAAVKNLAKKRKGIVVSVIANGKRVGGTVVVSAKGKVLATERVSSKKRVTVELPKLTKGLHTVRVTFIGTSKIAASSTSATLRQR